jgi:hypothetical protein
LNSLKLALPVIVAQKLCAGIPNPDDQQADQNLPPREASAVFSDNQSQYAKAISVKPEPLRVADYVQPILKRFYRSFDHSNRRTFGFVLKY